jgi:glycerol-3-phosphate acyltransferase PlsY
VNRLLGAAVCGYLLGSVSFADLVSTRRVDLRTLGSGNPGAMNARRVLGRRAGAAVALGDISKGIVACVAGRALAGDAGAHVGGVAAVTGHCYPLWAPRRGGKGVATSFGQCLATFPAYAPVDVAVALGAARLPGVRRPALVSVAVSSLMWVLAGVLWWRRRLPHLWGPPPSGLLPVANAATCAVIASRAAVLLARREPDELALDR